MGSFFRKPIAAFFLTMFVLAAIFFLVPVNLFDAEYIYNVNGLKTVVETKTSLSYFIGIGVSKEDMQDVVAFRLVPMGYFMVFLFLFALPLLIAYRVSLANQQDKK